MVRVTSPKIVTSSDGVLVNTTLNEAPFQWQRSRFANAVNIQNQNAMTVLFDIRNGKIHDMHHASMADFLVAYHKACHIDGRIAWLDFPIDDPRNNNMFYVGQHGMLHTLRHYWEYVKMSDVDAVMRQLRAALLDYQDRRYTSSLCVFMTQDGTTFYVDYVNKKLETVDMVHWEDHVLYGGAFPVIYDPSITSHPLVDDFLDGISDDNATRRDRIVETNLSSGLIGAWDGKGLVVNVGRGGDGKTTLGKVRAALFGEDAVLAIDDINMLAGKFGISQIAGSRFVVADEKDESPIAAAASAKLKSAVTAAGMTGEVKGETERIRVLGQAYIINTNHDIKLSQNEATTAAWIRRLVVNQFLRQFDTGDPATSTHDDSLAEKIKQDPEAMSYLFNLALDGVRRILENRKYTYVAEDEKRAKEMLRGVDTVADFLDEYDVFARWGVPHLVKFGTGYRDYAMVFPFSYTPFQAHQAYEEMRGESKYVSASYLDERDGMWRYFIPHDINLVMVGFSNEPDILYGIYEAMQSRTGRNGKGKLGREAFLKKLKEKLGFVSIQIKLPLNAAKRARVLCPADVQSKADYDAYTDSLHDEIVAELNPKTETDEPDTIPEPKPLTDEESARVDALIFDEPLPEEIAQAEKAQQEVSDTKDGE